MWSGLYEVRLELFVVGWEETGSEEYWTWWPGLYTFQLVELGKFGRTIKRVLFVPKGQGSMRMWPP